MSRKALSLAQELSHPHSLAVALCCLGCMYIFFREKQAAQKYAEATISFSAEQGFPFWLAVGTVYRGWALVQRGEIKEGIAQIQLGLAASQATGAGVHPTVYVGLLAEAYGKAGQVEEGFVLLDEALVLAQENGERFFEAELYRLKGELLLAQSEENHAEAEACFHQAIDIARRQSAKSWELRATMSLARLLREQGKNVEARQRLAEIYGWFTEGFDTADLQEARTLLKDMNKPGASC